MKKEIKIEFEELAAYGVRQFVRNKMLKVLLDNVGSKKEQVIPKIEKDLLQEFKKIARDEAKKVFAEIDKKVEERVKGKNIIERNEKLVISETMGRITGTVEAYRQILELGDYKEGYIVELLTSLEQILKEWKSI